MNRQLRNKSSLVAYSGNKGGKIPHFQKYANSLLIVGFCLFLLLKGTEANGQSGAQMVLKEKALPVPSQLSELFRGSQNNRIIYYCEIVADPDENIIATLSSFSFNLDGDFVAGDISSLKLYFYPYSEEQAVVIPDEFPPLSEISNITTPNTYTFNDISWPIQYGYPYGNASGVYIITMDVPETYLAGSSVFVQAVHPNNFSFLENDAVLVEDVTYPTKDGGEIGFLANDCVNENSANGADITFPLTDDVYCGSITATKVGGTSLYWQTTPTGTSTAYNGASYTYSGSSKYLYIRYLINDCWSTYILRTPLITVNQLAVIGTQPSNLTVNAGASATFSVVLNPTNSAATFQWQESTDNGGSWSDIINGAPFSNATTATLGISPVTGDFNSYQYRCIVSVPICGNVTSSSATLTVNAGSIYRSTGNNGAWSNALSWEVSTTGDDGTFVAASHPPDNTTTSIDIQHNINLDANVSLDHANLNIAASGHLTLDGSATITGGSPASVLNVYGLITTTDKDGLQCADDCPFNTTSWTINLNTGSTIEYNYDDIVIPIDDQTISPLTYHHLKLVNTSTVKKTSGPTTVNGTLTLGAPLKTTDGTLSLGNTGTIDFDEGATQSALTIEGPIAKVFNSPLTAFTFPLGSAAIQQPITVWPTTEAGVTYTVEFVNDNPATLFGANVTGAELNGLYINKYWKVKRSGSFGSARIGLSYVNPDNANAWSTTSDPPPFSAVALAHLGTNGYWQFSKNDKDFSDQAGNAYYEALPPTLNDTVFTGSLTTFTSGEGGANDFVPVTFGYGTAAILTLPVQITAFEAKAFSNNEVRLNWSLEETQDLKAIAIQISADGKHFGNLTQWVYTKVQGNQMSYVHKNAGAGTIYYRLQLRSKDGSLRYSRVRLVVIGVDVTVLTGILQNPVWGNEVIATLHAAKPQRIFANIVDIAGRKVSQQQLAVGKGEAQCRIPVHALPKGWYFLQIRTEDGKQRTDKFQIQ